jgi:voltage-gated potassium channel
LKRKEEGTREELSLEIEQIEIASGSSLIGRSLKEAHIHADYDVMVIAIRRADEQMIFDPSADTALQVDDALMALGSHANLERLEKEANPSGTSRPYHSNRQ